MMEDRWAVVGVPYEKARQLINQIERDSGKEVSKRIQSRFDLITEFTDGTVLRWVRASASSRGHKFGKMWCDKNINIDVFRTVILPCYWGELKDIIWI